MSDRILQPLRNFNLSRTDIYIQNMCNFLASKVSFFFSRLYFSNIAAELFDMITDVAIKAEKPIMDSAVLLGSTFSLLFFPFVFSMNAMNRADVRVLSVESGWSEHDFIYPESFLWKFCWTMPGEQCPVTNSHETARDEAKDVLIDYYGKSFTK